MTTRSWALVIAILTAAAFRFLPHPPNATPVVAMALFGGAYLTDRRAALAVVFGSMLLSDLVLGFHITMLAVYPCLLLIVFLGGLLRERRGAARIAAASIGASCLFFVVSNFGVWALQAMYPKTVAGLMMCYTAALPFFRTLLVGDLVFCTLLFGGFALLERRMVAIAR